MADDDRDTVLKALVAGGGILIAGRFLELGITFIGKLLIARYLGRFGFGAVSIGLSVAMLVVGVGMLALHSGVGRFLPRFDDPEDRRGVIVSATQLSFPLLVGSTILLLVFAPALSNRVFRDPSLTPVLRAFAILIPLAGIERLAIGASQGQERTGLKVAIENLAIPVVRLAGIGIALLLGLGVIGVVWAYVFAYLLAALIGGAYLVRYTELFADVEYRAKHGELLRFSAPLVLMSLSGLILADIDTMLLASLRTTGEVGIYNVVYPLSRLGLMALGPIAFIAMPVLSRLHADDRLDDMQSLYRFLTKWLILFSLPAFGVMIVIPRRMVTLLFGAEYAPGATALVILSLGFLAFPVAGQVSEVMKSVNLTRLLLVASVAAAVLNLGLNLVLIPPFGIEGAAVATTVAYVGQNGLLVYKLRAETGLFPVARTEIGYLIGGLGAIAALAFLVRTFDPGVPAIVAGGGLVIIAYGIVILKLAVNRDEIMLFLSFEEDIPVDLEPVKRVLRLVVETE